MLLCFLKPIAHFIEKMYQHWNLELAVRIAFVCLCLSLHAYYTITEDWQCTDWTVQENEERKKRSFLKKQNE